MDRQLLERLIGAGVLVIALVIIVPAILDGEGGGESESVGEPAVPVTSNEPRRTYTIRPDQSAQSPPVAREVTQPAISDDAAGANGNSREPAKPPATPTVRPPVQAPPKPVRAPDPAPVETVAVSNEGWAVQLGSFSSRQNAQQLANEVGARGFPVFLMTIDRSGKKLYRVRVGPRESRPQAVELAERLQKAGYAGQVTQ